MRTIKPTRLGSAPTTSLTQPLLVAMSLFVLTGCRNTTSTPVSPMGNSSMLSPLSPVQGAAPLSPIQATSGLSTFGAPTRVPPPPTGSYNPSTNYGSSSTFGSPASSYAPTSAPPTGANLGSNGLTRGVTDLMASNSPSATSIDSPTNSGVRQTAWVAEGTSSTSPPPNPVPSTNAPSPLRLGGMQVIDLTNAPYPPGYVPPQNPPQNPSSFQAPPPYQQPASQSEMSPSLTNQTPASSMPIGQPTNSTFVRSSSESMNVTSSGDQPAVQTAGRPSGAMLPSTDPFPTVNESGTDDLQWRRPSPRF